MHPSSYILVLLLLNMVGCTALQPTDPYAPISPRQGFIPYASPALPAPTRLEPSGEPFTLDRCIEVALANNPELAATSQEVSAAGSRVDQAKAQRWPTLSAEGGYARFLDPQRLLQAQFNGEPGIFDVNLARGDLIIKMPLFTGGRIVNEIAATELLRQAEENRLARTGEELVFNVSSFFYAILGQRKVIQSLEFSITAMEEHLKQVEALLAAQKAAKVDFLRTEVRLADLRQNLVKEQNVLAVQKRVLAGLLGLDYDTERFGVEGKLAFEEVSLDATALTAQALGGRPDYLAAKARLEAQGRRVDVARAGHLPTLSVIGNYGLRSDLSSDEENAGSVGLGVTFPLFEGGRVMAKVEEERSTLAAAQERLRKLQLQIRQDVETAVLEVRSSSERVKALAKSIEQGRESLRIERQKYDLGMGSMTDVLDAQSALLQAETNYYRALADFRTALARLDFATGRQRS
jgi:outer membrane protein